MAASDYRNINLAKTENSNSGKGNCSNRLYSLRCEATDNHIIIAYITEDISFIAISFHPTFFVSAAELFVCDLQLRQPSNPALECSELLFPPFSSFPSACLSVSDLQG